MGKDNPIVGFLYELLNFPYVLLQMKSRAATYPPRNCHKVAHLPRPKARVAKVKMHQPYDSYCLCSSQLLNASYPLPKTGKGKAPAPRKSTSPVPLAKRFPSKSSGSEMNLTSIIQGVVFRELSEKEDVDVGYVIGQLEGAVYNTTQKHFGEDPSTELVLDEEVMGISDLFNSSAPENEGETMRSLFRTSDHWFQSIESALESPEADKRVSPKVPFPISDSFPRFELHQRNEVSSDGSFPRRIKGELKPWALGEEGSTMRELFGQFTGFQLECDPEGDANAFFSCTEVRSNDKCMYLLLISQVAYQI